MYVLRTTACEILAAYVMLLYEAITSYCFMRLCSFVMDMYMPMCDGTVVMVQTQYKPIVLSKVYKRT